MPYGLLPTGFRPKPYEVQRAEIVSGIKQDRGPSTQTEVGWIGTLIDIVSSAITKMYDIGNAIYASLDRDKATGDALARLGVINGTYALGAAHSSVIATLTGDPLTPVGVDTMLRTVSTLDDFLTTEPVTLSLLPSWVSGAVTEGQRFTNAGRCYQVRTPGNSVLGPTSSSVIVDTEDGVTWYYLGTGTAAADVLAVSVEFDAIPAAATDLRLIQTPLVGLKGAFNVAEAVLGRKRQSDSSFRVAQQRSPGALGSGTERRLLADATKLGVTSIGIFNNISDVTDGNGQPPHSVQLLVEGSTDDLVAAMLLAQVGVGIPTFGNITKVLTDSKGKQHTIKFSRPVAVPIWLSATVKYNPATWPSGAGVDLVKAALLSYTTTNTPGRDLVSDAVSAGIYGAYGTPATGVVQVVSLMVGTAPSPVTSTPIVITPFQIATLDVGRITVSSSSASSV